MKKILMPFMFAFVLMGRISGWSLDLPIELADIQSVVFRNITEEELSLVNKLTIITTTSPIPSNPRTDMIERTQASLARIPALRGCKKIIVFDGVPPGEEYRIPAYNEYKANIMRLTQTSPFFLNTKFLILEEHHHLAYALREAMKLVDTPYVYVHQHDFELVRDFDIRHLILSMDFNPNLKHIRLNRLFNVPNEWDGLIDNVIEGGSFVPLTRTFGWSDNDHISRKDYYMNFIFPQIVFKGPMECFIHPKESFDVKVNPQLHTVYGTYIYGWLNDSPYIWHWDGRYYP